MEPRAGETGASAPDHDDVGCEGDRHDAMIRLVVAPGAGVFTPSLTADDIETRMRILAGQVIGTITTTAGALAVRSGFDGHLGGLQARSGERVRPGEIVAWLQVS